MGLRSENRDYVCHFKIDLVVRSIFLQEYLFSQNRSTKTLSLQNTENLVIYKKMDGLGRWIDR